MAIEDINGYKPHTDEKVELVNQIKNAENELGKILTALSVRLHAEYVADPSAVNGAGNYYARSEQLKIARQKLKECSMWACRSVFQPTETY